MLPSVVVQSKRGGKQVLSNGANEVREWLRNQKIRNQQSHPSLEEQRQRLAAMGSLPVDPTLRVTRTVEGGVAGEWIEPVGSRTHRVWLYLHGGAYASGGPDSHRALASRLALTSGSRIRVADYRLAPEHRFPAAVEDSIRAYVALLEKGISPQSIVVGGDSAGGGLTVALLVSLRDQRIPLPKAMVLLSPWTDLAATGSSLVNRRDRDPWLDASGIAAAGRLYLGSADPKNPLASPLYADLRGLCPALIHVGDDEVLLEDSVRLAQRLQEARVPVTIKVFPGMWHVFHAFFAKVPEANAAIEEIGQWVQQRVPDAMP